MRIIIMIRIMRLLVMVMIFMMKIRGEMAAVREAIVQKITEFYEIIS